MYRPLANEFAPPVRYAVAAGAINLDQLPITGSRPLACSATMRADFDLPENPHMSACQTPIIVALDFPTRDAALKLADQLDPKLCRVNVGKELFTSCAADIVETLRNKGFEVFLDLKFHDILIPLRWPSRLRRRWACGWSTCTAPVACA